jgi:DNA (cytosine-5)-methyltransferase 1
MDLANDNSSNEAYLHFMHKRTRDVIAPTDLQVVDLFCGAGGLALGFELAGFQAVTAVDIWSEACDTFRLGHPTATVLNADISDVPDQYFTELLDISQGDLGIVCGGPPCQGFSVAGRSLTDDPRNFLYKHFLRAISDLHPKWVVMENVPALLNHPNVAQAIQADFGSITLPGKAKYDLQWKTVNAADYGVPQTRSRVIFVAKRSDVKTLEEFDLDELMKPLFSKDENLFGDPRYIWTDEAISDLPAIEAGEGEESLPYDKDPTNAYQSLMRGQSSPQDFFSVHGISVPSFCSTFRQSDVVHNHVAQNHSALLVERFANIPPGGSKEDLRRVRPDLLPPEGHAEQGLTYGRLWLDRPATTIPANYSRPSGNRSIHPSVPRLITPREAMRLSSFPDSYQLTGGKGAQREQVGNAVPPLLSFHLARKIRELSGN